MTMAFVEGTAVEASVLPTGTRRADQGVAVISAPAPFEPSTMRIASLQHPAFRLKRVIELQLFVKDGKAVIWWKAGQIEASGSILPEALSRFQAAVIANAAALEEYVSRV